MCEFDLYKDFKRKKMNKFVDDYQSSISFLRDVFQYTIPGVIFLSVLYYLFPITLNENIKTDIITFYPIKGSFLDILTIVIFSYFIGKLANSISSTYFILFKWILKKLRINPSFFEIRELKDRIAETLYPNSNNEFSSKMDIAIKRDYLYNQIATYNLGLYKNRIERYNNITMYYKTLASISLFVLIVSFFLDSPFNMSIIHLISVFLIGFFFYLWVVTEKSLLIMEYTIAVEIIDMNKK